MWCRAWWRQGGLAAALSTADGLLLTISNALVRDLYFQDAQRKASPEQRVILSKFALLAVALSAAFVAALKPSEILPMVSASFSLAASAFVPVMVLGHLLARHHPAGGGGGHVGQGLGITVYYMLSHVAALQRVAAAGSWRMDCGFESSPISAGRVWCAHSVWCWRWW